MPADEKAAPLGGITSKFHKEGWKTGSGGGEERAFVRGLGPERQEIAINREERKVWCRLDHPKRGEGVLLRENVSTEDVKQLAQDPRAHLGKGVGWEKVQAGEGMKEVVERMGK